jgi:hypothetical protein
MCSLLIQCQIVAVLTVFIQRFRSACNDRSQLNRDHPNQSHQTGTIFPLVIALSITVPKSSVIFKTIWSNLSHSRLRGQTQPDTAQLNTSSNLTQSTAMTTNEMQSQIRHCNDCSCLDWNGTTSARNLTYDCFHTIGLISITSYDEQPKLISPRTIPLSRVQSPA